MHAEKEQGEKELKKTSLDKLIAMLDDAYARNGDREITLKMLLNILKMLRRIEEEDNVH